MACGEIAFLLKGEDVVRRLERILAPAAGGFGQPVQVGQAGVAQRELVPVFLPDREGRGVDHEHRFADRLGILDDIGRAALAAGRLAVPHREQHIGAVHRLHAAVEVGVLACAVLGDDAYMFSLLQGGLHRGPFLRGEILGKFRARQRQDGVPGETRRPRLFDKHLVAADRDGRQRDPFALRRPPQFCQGGRDGLRRRGGVGQQSVAGKAYDMEQGQLGSSAHRVAHRTSGRHRLSIAKPLEWGGTRSFVCPNHLATGPPGRHEFASPLPGPVIAELPPQLLDRFPSSPHTDEHRIAGPLGGHDRAV